MLHHMLRAAAQRAFSTLDPYFKYVTMLLHGDGSALGSDTVTPFNSDASTNAFNVTINGDARSNNFNPYQEGYYSNYFDGSGDNLTLTNNSTLALSNASAFCIEFFAYITSTSNTPYVITAYDPSSGSPTGYSIRVNSGNWEMYDGTSWASFGTCTTNSWIHVAVSYEGSGTTRRYFLNGVQQGSAATVPSTISYTGAGPYYIGNSNNGTNALTGYISNLRVVKGSAVYTANFTPPTSPLTAITNTQLLTCQSNRFIDNSTNAFVISKANDTAVAPAQPFTLPSSVATYGSGYFDGSGDYFSVASQTALGMGAGDFTYEAWIYVNEVVPTNALRGLYDSRVSGATGCGIYTSADSGTTSKLVYTTNSAIAASSTNTIKPYCWTYVAVTRSSGTVRGFLNGVLEFTVTDSRTFSSSAATYIGTDVSPQYFNGYITDARILKGTAQYTANFTPPTAPLTAITNTSLLTTQYNGAGNNNGFKDSSQNNFPITRNGNTTQGTFTPYGSNWSNYFNGSSYLTVPSSSAFKPASSDFTIEAWVFVSNTGVLQTVYGDCDSGTNNGMCELSVSSTLKVEVDYFTSSTAVVTKLTTGSIQANAWNHICVSKTGTTMYIGYNGTLETFTGVPSTMQSPATLYPALGRLGAYAGYYINGYISNFRFVVGSAVYTGSTYTVPISPLTAISGTSLLTCQSNRFIDNSSNSFAITTGGSSSVQRFSPFSPTTAYSTSVIGGSGYFDGSGDSLTLANNAAFNLGANNFTIEAWVYVTATPGGSGAVIVGKNSATYPGGYEFNLVVDTGRTIFFGAYTSSLVSLQGTIVTSLNAWNHVAAVRSGSNWALFVNGVRDVTATSSGTVQTTSSSVYVGDYGGGGRNLTGYSSNIRLVNGSAVYDPTSSTLTVPTAPLTAVSGTSLLLNYTNAGILDNAMMNDLETVGNAQISTSVKKYGSGSMYFDGTGDYLTAPVNSQSFNLGSGDFTVEFWVYTNSSGSNQDIVCLNPNSNQSSYATLRIVIESSTFKYYLSTAGTTWNYSGGSASVTGSTWYHVALVRNGSTVTFYINGTSNATSSVSTNSLYFGDAQTRIGNLLWSGGNQYLNGYIDDLRITKGVARYTTTFTPPTAAFPNN